MARGSGSQEEKKYIKASYALAGIVLAVGIMLVIMFCSVRLVQYIDVKDYEEGICHAENVYQYIGDDEADFKKIWCSCNDKERNEHPPPCVDPKVRASGSFSLPCMRLNVTVKGAGKSTWLRNTYHKKGSECTNCCIHRTVEELFKVGEEFVCWYDPSDSGAQVIVRERPTSWIVHSLLWPGLLVLGGLVWLVITCVCHVRQKKSGSQSYV